MNGKDASEFSEHRKICGFGTITIHEVGSSLQFGEDSDGLERSSPRMINSFIYSEPEGWERLSQGEQVSFEKHTAQIVWKLRKLDEQIQGRRGVGEFCDGSNLFRTQLTS